VVTVAAPDGGVPGNYTLSGGAILNLCMKREPNFFGSKSLTVEWADIMRAGAWVVSGNAGPCGTVAVDYAKFAAAPAGFSPFK